MIFFRVRQAEKQGKAIRKEKGTRRKFSYVADILMSHTAQIEILLVITKTEIFCAFPLECYPVFVRFLWLGGVDGMYPPLFSTLVLY